MVRSNDPSIVSNGGGSDGDVPEELVLSSGLPLLWQQLVALTRKNLTLVRRQRASAFLKLFSPFMFILLLFCIDEAYSSLLSDKTAFRHVRDPDVLLSPPIPPCEDKYYTRLPCYDFVWSGNSSKRIANIVSAIRNNNPGRRIPPEKVMSFHGPREVDAWLLGDPMRCPAALHFKERNATVISYGIQTNSTPIRKGGKFEDPNFKFQIPLQIAAEREIARNLIGDPKLKWEVGLQEFAHPATTTFSTVSMIGPTIFLAVSMFGFVFQIGTLVSEKELRLRQAMSTMGLYESAYWLSWLTWETFETLVSALLILISGMIFQFNFFLKNNTAILFLVFFLFQVNMLGFAFFISTFLQKSSTATTVGFFIFITGFLTQMVTTESKFPYDMDTPTSRYYRIIWSFYPPNLLAIATKILSDATATSEDQGLSWSQRDQCSIDKPNCKITVEDTFKWLISTFFLWIVLALYLDNILPDSNGVRKPLYYFLIPSYWTGRGGNNLEEGKICSCTGSIPTLEESTPSDQDVRQEETTVREADPTELDSNIAVQMRGLVKTYPGTTNIGCCKCNKTPPYHAVRGLWLNIPRNQLFCLLGPNGAGKTTVINCLTGITPVTSGDALIHENSIRSTIGISTSRRLMGVCPQFDILWDALSGKEHLKLFANIKGLQPSKIDKVTEKALADVRLLEAGGMRASSYSGGMRRRLSVAIALIGDPKLVFLDEPTTGMDPISRRHVWDIIEEAKRGRAIILTTHSMEEADILSDRIAIMAKGKLRCIGSSIHLKSRFGTGYVTNISFLTNGQATPEFDALHLSHVQAVKEFFRIGLDILPKEENGEFLTFVIPREKEGLLSDFFAELEERKEEFRIADIQLGLTTLEEVFLNIAREAELESASAEGTMVTLNLTSGKTIQIPKGARFIGIPGSETEENPRGFMVEVFWVEDDSTGLCISNHSPEIPIPQNVQSPVNGSSPQRPFLGWDAIPFGENVQAENSN